MELELYTNTDPLYNRLVNPKSRPIVIASRARDKTISHVGMKVDPIRNGITMEDVNGNYSTANWPPFPESLYAFHT